jgi:ABC-2 type transport system ATP-binding protein
VVIFDEPTVGLDPSIRRQLWDIIKRLKEEGVTVIITTHYLDEAEVLADRACIMNRGKIILIETVARLKAQYNGKSFEEIFLDITNHAEEANGEALNAG